MDIQVAIKSIGQKRAKMKIERIHLPTLTPNCTLKAFIMHMVAAQVAAFNAKQVGNDTKDQIQTPLAHENYLNLLTQTGKATFGMRYNDKPADVADAQENALQCFEDGMFAVFVDDDEVASLEQVLNLTEDNVVSFIRLTFLAGGYF